MPCYNEEEVLCETAERLNEKYCKLFKDNIISENSKIIFVDDGSDDKTWDIIKKLHNTNNIFSGIKLSRNRGQQNAILAGLMTAKDFADIVISMDAYLQDDIDAIDEMIQKYNEGYDIVYGVRSERETDTFFKRSTAESFYKIADIFGGELIFNHADFRLMSKRAIAGLTQFRETNLFLRGIVPMIGYPSTKIFYKRNERFAGKSKFGLKQMLYFAIEGITSLSVTPIRLVTRTGLVVFVFSVIMLVYILIRYFTGQTVWGWASVAVSVWLIGGLLLLSVGIIGEYIGKIYLETKERPKYIIEEFLHKQ